MSTPERSLAKHTRHFFAGHSCWEHQWQHGPAIREIPHLRIAEVVEMDMQISEGKVVTYRTKVWLSFKYHTDED